MGKVAHLPVKGAVPLPMGGMTSAKISDEIPREMQDIGKGDPMKCRVGATSARNVRWSAKVETNKVRNYTLFKKNHMGQPPA